MLAQQGQESFPGVVAVADGVDVFSHSYSFALSSNIEAVPDSSRVGLYGMADWVRQQATDILRGDVAVKAGITPMIRIAHMAEGFRMKCELHHGGNSLNNVANLHITMAINNCDYFEVLLPDSASKYGHAVETAGGILGRHMVRHVEVQPLCLLQGNRCDRRGPLGPRWQGSEYAYSQAPGHVS